MIKEQLYGKTQRLGNRTYEWLLTEKLDGANLVVFVADGTLYAATRNRIIEVPAELNENKNTLYKGLYEWLRENGATLADLICEGTAICGEWLGMGQIKYPETMPRFNMFAKATVTADGGAFTLEEYVYDPAVFWDAFTDKVDPDCIGRVPVIDRLREAPTVERLNAIYTAYTARVDRPVEGIVITQKPVDDWRCKYVRMKCGMVGPHITAEEMDEIKAARLRRGA